MVPYTKANLLEKLFFNQNVSDAEKKEIEELYLEVWGRIYEKAGAETVTKIYGNLEFVVYKSIIESTFVGRGGSTGRSSYQCFVIYYPRCEAGTKIDKEGKLFALAHEFAHVLYNHPKASPPTPIEREKNEQEAGAKAVEWGFMESKCK